MFCMSRLMPWKIATKIVKSTQIEFQKLAKLPTLTCNRIYIRYNNISKYFQKTLDDKDQSKDIKQKERVGEKSLKNLKSRSINR